MRPKVFKSRIRERWIVLIPGERPKGFPTSEEAHRYARERARP